ncbi:hypothetical protein D3C71_1347290 [compost metagenome]
MPAGTRSRTSTSDDATPLTVMADGPGTAEPVGCASCAPMLEPLTVKSMRVVPGTITPGYDADLTSEITAALLTVITSRLVAVCDCNAVVAVRARHAMPPDAAGSVPCTSSAAVSPGLSDSAPALPSGSTGSPASTTPLLLTSRTTRKALRSSWSGPQPPALLAQASV